MNRFAACLLSFALILSLCACSKTQPTPTPDATPEATPEVTAPPTWAPDPLDYSKRPATLVVCTPDTPAPIYPIQIPAKDVSVLVPEEEREINLAYESDQLKVEFLTYIKNLNGTPIINVQLINKYAAKLNIEHQLHLTINGYAAPATLQAGGDYVDSMEANENIEAVIALDAPEMPINGVYNISGAIETSSDMVSYADTVKFDLNLSKETQPYPNDNTGVLIYTNEDVLVYVAGYDVPAAQDETYRLVLYVVNNSDKDYTIRAANCVLNGDKPAAPVAAEYPVAWAHSRSLGYLAWDASAFAGSLYSVGAQFWIQAEDGQADLTEDLVFVLQ